MGQSAAVNKQGGLAGVIAGESAICTCGLGNGLNYYGYDIHDLAQYATFEEVAYLLQFGELPTQRELDLYTQKIRANRALSEPLKALLKAIPKDSHPMNLMQMAIAALGALEPEREDFLDQDEKIIRLLGVAPSILCYWHHWVNFGQEIDFHSSQESIAGYFLHKLQGKQPKEDFVAALQCSLILYAEHEFNASTFSARITASTKSDIFSCVAAAIGALRGPLHGGANEAAMHLIESFLSPSEAVEAVLLKLKNKELLMGFGHRIYGKEGDPRNALIKSWSKRLGGDTLLFQISQAIEQTMQKERPQIPPNADFYSASAYHFLGIPTPYFTPIFIMSRASGWCAHIKEQRANNKLIRPSSQYIGPNPREFVKIEQR